MFFKKSNYQESIVYPDTDEMMLKVLYDILQELQQIRFFLENN